MNYSLLVCINVKREKFQIEDYIGEDNILALVESGSFSFDEGGGTQTAEPFDAVNFKKGKPYHRHIIDAASIYLFRYKADAEIFAESKITFKNKDRIKSTIELLKAADSSMCCGGFRYKQSLFSDIITQYRLENMSLPEALSDKDEVIHAAVEEINAGIHRKINLAQIANKHFLSYVQFLRRFKLAVGMSPQDYIVELRMKKAQQMLGESDLSVKEIAAECGFANEYYFSNFFKKYNNLSPSEFRKIISSTNNS